MIILWSTKSQVTGASMGQGSTLGEVARVKGPILQGFGKVFLVVARNGKLSGPNAVKLFN